jgi:hypothetical protein
VLPFAIGVRTSVAAGPREDGLLARGSSGAQTAEGIAGAFARAGLTAPRLSTVAPSDGARRDR